MILLLSALFFAVATDILGASEVINKSGFYLIGTDITYNPAGSDDAIIMITASNVTVDLDFHILSQQSGNFQSGLDAIVVAPSVSHVTIKNGYINAVTGRGISIGDGCTDITIEEITISRCNEAGIVFDGLTSGTGIIGGLIEHTTITTCTGAGGNPAYGLKMVKVNQCLVRQVNIAYNDAGITANGYGVYLDTCQNINVALGVASNNGGLNAYGLYGTNLTACLFREFITQSNISRDLTGTATVAGFLLESSVDCLLFNCRSTNNTTSYGQAYGYFLRNGAANRCGECLSAYNTGKLTTAGFLLSAESMSSVAGNSISEINQSTNGTCYGILLSNSCDKCQITNNKIFDNSGSGATFGVADLGSPSTSAFLGNYAFNNGTNYSVTYPVGVILPIISGSLSSAVPGLPSGVCGVFDNVSLVP